jgi:hypothetical protein
LFSPHQTSRKNYYVKSSKNTIKTNRPKRECASIVSAGDRQQNCSHWQWLHCSTTTTTFPQKGRSSAATTATANRKRKVKSHERAKTTTWAYA